MAVNKNMIISRLEPSSEAWVDTIKTSNTFTVEGANTKSGKAIQVKFDRIMKYLDSGENVYENFASNYNPRVNIGGIYRSLLSTIVRRNWSYPCIGWAAIARVILGQNR